MISQGTRELSAEIHERMWVKGDSSNRFVSALLLVMQLGCACAWTASRSIPGSPVCSFTRTLDACLSPAAHPGFVSPEKAITVHGGSVFEAVVTKEGYTEVDVRANNPSHVETSTGAVHFVKVQLRIPHLWRAPHVVGLECPKREIITITRGQSPRGRGEACTLRVVLLGMQTC
jgi:hypothetical protein